MTAPSRNREIAEAIKDFHDTIHFGDDFWEEVLIKVEVEHIEMEHQALADWYDLCLEKEMMQQ